MAKIFDVPADDSISKLSEQLKKDKKINPPTWSELLLKLELMQKKCLKIKIGGIHDVLL